MKEYKYKINGNSYKVAIGDIDNNIAQVEVNGIPYKVEIDSAKKPVTVVNAPRPSAAPRTESGAKVISKPAASASGGYQIKAPLPGTILSIAVKVGDTVKAADTVAVLEAMKMENAIHAGRDGVVAAVNANTGDAVLEGAPIITLQ
ncbi:MAG: biotin/lipoyl-binding protein [Bacteroides sp.]|nr:biotin/lipoyl-binding protein [Bacteroides sp.]MCM1413197.1 biotin/lipoyl-binding protein [Bacteroides sp.]MCM1472061.1 biotin/lipoyl-binding protein [Bacteroides sp.]